MDALTTSAALTRLAAPYLLKAGGSAWGFITSRFKSKELAAIDPSKGLQGPASVETLKQKLLKQMQDDPELLQQSQQYVTQIQPATTIVNQYGDKSFNVGNNLGTIRFS